jgi:hypothetical protein
MESLCHCEQTTGVTKSRTMAQSVTVGLDSIKPCWEEFNLDFKKWETWPIISNRVKVFVYYLTETIVPYFRKLGKLFWERLRLKINLRTCTQFSDQPFVAKFSTLSRPTDSDGRIRFRAIWTSKFEIGATDKISVYWIIEKMFQSKIL